MFSETDPGLSWLNITNFALGAVVLIALAAVIGGVVREVLARARSRVHAGMPADDHAFVLPELGLTMADGGEKEKERKPGEGGGNDVRHYKP